MNTGKEAQIGIDEQLLIVDCKIEGLKIYIFGDCLQSLLVEPGLLGCCNNGLWGSTFVSGFHCS